MRTSTANPFLQWIQLALRTGEMLWASGQVIPIRLGRMAAAGHQPSARDRKEFARMAPEKLQAGTESLLAVGLKLQAMQLQWLAQAWRPWFTSAGWQPWGAPATWQRTSSDLARLGSAALAPVHAASRANAKRLTRPKSPAGAARW
ncbi:MULTISPECIES: polyhydroxyalkanoate granule-associated phasin [Ramlibacter]|uniref:Uncharacterized protein n=1 Tax=Ramlibacter pinisoli TaxID=2682844 RepID=A0A6N8IMW5_9BURK|nr:MULTISPECIES: polyhydroxyalkanoate granule-associated phasin [Ramlibacter]MBA2960574.1 hypothetical protein [Ramlibacter sp. CGMCC 1.13660]MVQ27905.1 hypothetical protein [Ramlibacter pinisoli]